MLLVNLCTNDIIAVHIVYIHLLVISVEVLKLYLQFLLLGRKKKRINSLTASFEIYSLAGIDF